MALVRGCLFDGFVDRMIAAMPLSEYGQSLLGIITSGTLGVVVIVLICHFLTCVRRTDVIAVGWTSVCLSVRPSHAGIVSKRLNLSSNCLHRLVAP